MMSNGICCNYDIVIINAENADFQNTLLFKTHRRNYTGVCFERNTVALISVYRKNDCLRKADPFVIESKFTTVIVYTSSDGYFFLFYFKSIALDRHINVIHQNYPPCYNNLSVCFRLPQAHASDHKKS